MENAHSPQESPGALANLDDVRRIVGDIEDGKALEILALRPTTEELEEAATWAGGNGDVLAKEGHPLSGKAAAIFDILTADEEEPPPVH